MFKGADVVIITKIDPAQAVEWPEELARENIRKIAPQALIIEVSARKDMEMTPWYNYLHQAKQEKTGKFAII
jgi:hydrogenase nickel incorporation protein HypB